MNPLKQGPHAEGLKIARLIMVLSSLSPLFILWSIRGTNLIPDMYFITGCLAMAILPTGFLHCRELLAKRQRDVRSLVVGKIEDHRGHVLVYLFAILLPFYRQNVESWRDFSALMAALVFIVFLFWHLNYHYMNIVFALRGYRVLSVLTPEGDSEGSSMKNFALITRRSSVEPNERLVAYRLSNTVYMEKNK